ncbi:MAG: NUDIX hydrolase [Bacteroidota bacterium]
MERWLLDQAKRIRALAQAGLHFSENHFDLERFEELEQISAEVLARLSGTTIQSVEAELIREAHYPTPKVDIRAVIFQQQQVLLVKEKSDHKWSLPGGWADIAYTPAQVAEKETLEEAGLVVKAQEIMAVYDNRYHEHPPSLTHIYKIFIRCQVLEGEAKSGVDTEAVAYFDRDNLPELSRGRVTHKEMDDLFDQLGKSPSPTLFD